MTGAGEHQVTFVLDDGERKVMSLPDGTSVMRAAVNNDIEGIIGECGGQLMCATCHVYVDSPGPGPLPPMSEDEDFMLDTAASPRKDNSRLSCQLPIGPDLDGIVLILPESQL